MAVRAKQRAVRPSRRSESLRVVISCDQGAPSELMRDSLTVGRALMDQGHTVSYVVGDPIALVDYAGAWTPTELYQAPAPRSAPHLVMKRPPVDGFADLMATAGFDDKQMLITLASMWNRQLRALKPDAIVGFYSPVLWLVGPTHAPTFAIGNGFSLPPILGTSFPRLGIDSTPLADEALMLANANAVLSRFRQSSLASLSEVVSACTSLLYGLPGLDPYLRLRKSHTLGLLGEQPSPSVPPAEQRLAVFLDMYSPGIEMTVLALAGLHNIPIDIHVSGATTSLRRFLEQQPEVTFWSDHRALLEHAKSASALVHHGVQDVTQRCISLGRPQLLVPWTREQELLNYMVAWMSFSWMKPPTISVDEMAMTCRDLLRDASLMVAAQHYARQLAQTDIDDALPAIVAGIEERVRSSTQP